jgi:PAS domain S-box-containing protein
MRFKLLSSIGFSTIFRTWYGRNLHAFIFVSGLIIASITSYTYYSENQKNESNNFSRLVERTIVRINQQLKIYSYGLKAAAGIWAANSNRVTKKEFVRYSLSRDFDKEYHGALGFGFIENQTINEIQKNYRIQYSMPESSHGGFHDFDLADVPAIQGALEESLLTGTYSISRRFTVPDTANTENPLLGYMYVYPIYKTEERPGNFADRMTNHLGWIYCIVNVIEIINEPIADVTEEIEVKIYEGTVARQDSLIFGEEQNSIKKPSLWGQFKQEVIFSFAGQDFIMVAKSKSKFGQHKGELYALIIFLFISSLAIMTSLLVYYLKKINEHAAVMANDMTVEIQQKNMDLLYSLDQIQLSEQRVRATINAIPGLVSVIDVDYRYIDLNDELCKLIGLPREAIIGRLVGDFFWNESLNFITMISNHFTSSNEVHTGYVEMPIRGVQKNYLCTMKTYNDGQNMVIVSIDLTEQKRLEAEVEASKSRAANASRLSSLGEMAAGIAHEINNPLAIINGKAQQLNRLAMKEQHVSSAQVSEAALKISATVDRIAKIIRGLRTVARDGDSDPFLPITVISILQDAIELTRARLVNHGIKLLEPQVDPNLQIEGKSTQLVQVLINLINNSHDAVEHLEDKWIKIDVNDDIKFVYIHIIDAGNGIPKEVRDKIMQPFYTTKEVGKGTGLGLSISKGIAESHEGDLTINANNKNTEFILKIAKENSKTDPDYKGIKAAS